MKRVIFVSLICACAVPALAAAPERFLTVTITDIGRPYTIIDGFCFFKGQTNDISLSMETMFGSALTAANKVIVANAKAVGADAVVGMNIQAVGIPDPSNAANYFSHSGVMVCGTWVKFKQ